MSEETYTLVCQRFDSKTKSMYANLWGLKWITDNWTFISWERKS